jgi:hypothetical protein
MPGDATTFYFTQGVLGVTVVVLLYICAKLYNSREADRKEWRTEVKELNDLRLQDGRDVSEKVIGVMDNTSQNLRILSEKIEVGKENNRR